MSLEKILKAINKYNRFLISAHVNLEGDAICSELAMAQFLRSKGKKVHIVNESGVPGIYNFLPKIDTVRQLNKDIADFDAAIILDCSDMRRIGKVGRLLTKDKFVINIDHHISNEQFGDVNFVKPYASSAAEIIFEILKKAKYKIDKDVAIFLYVGIMTDTGSFRHTNTSSNTHRVVAELLKLKVPVSQIYRNIYGSNPASEMRLVSRLLRYFKLDKTGKIAWFTLSKKQIPKNELQVDLSEHLLNFLRSIKGVEVAAIMRESEDKRHVRINFRSNNKVDVNRIAKSFGGGGHRTASGCTVSGSINKTESLVLLKLRQALKS